MAGRSGFMESFNSLIAEMKRAQVTEADMERQLEGLEDSLLRRKLEDITTLYKAFNEQMDQAYFDDEDVLNLLIEKIDEATFLKDMKNMGGWLQWIYPAGVCCPSKAHGKSTLHDHSPYI